MTDAAQQVGIAVGARLRALRRARGLSLSALARTAGLGKGTLSELESGQRNPTLATLFALTTALDLPLSAALPSPAPTPPHAVGEAVDMWLVDSGPGVEVHRLRLRAGQEQWSAPHARGVIEELVLVTGRAEVGPDRTILTAGEALGYDGARPHLWRALDGTDASAVLVMRYPDLRGGSSSHGTSHA